MIPDSVTVNPERQRYLNKRRARRRVTTAVEAGRLAKPSTLACLDCGAPAREYDHYLGYAGIQHLRVQPVCRQCHVDRAIKRGERPERKRTMTTATAPDPGLALPPGERGLGSRTSGTYDNRPHYLGVGASGERKLRGQLTESRLRALREEAGLTQRRLATLTAEIDRAADLPTNPKMRSGAKNPRKPGERVFGVSAYSINRFENGVHSPRPRYLKLIADALATALGRPVSLDDLRVKDSAGLIAHLEKIRVARGAPVDAFYALLGIKNPARAELLIAGKADWTADELGRAAVLFPQARSLTQDVLVEQARRRDPTLAPA